jgi:hypothetical protein
VRLVLSPCGRKHDWVLHKQQYPLAHLIARIVYLMLKYKVECEQHYREQQLKYPQKKSAKFGFQLTPSLAVS